MVIPFNLYSGAIVVTCPGKTLIYPVLVSVVLPFTVRLIVFSPVELYDTECGPCVSAVAGVALSPKFQAQVLVVQVEASENIINKVFFLDDNIGWASEYLHGTILKTTTGGD